MLGVPSYNRPLVKGDTNDLPVTINADSAKVIILTMQPLRAMSILTGNSRLLADEVQLHQKQPEGAQAPVRTVDALGNVHYDDNQVILKGPKARSNLNTKDTNVWEGDYQMVGRQARYRGPDEAARRKPLHHSRKRHVYLLFAGQIPERCGQ